MNDLEVLLYLADVAKHVYHKPFVADALLRLAKDMGAEQVAKKQEGVGGVCC